MQMGQERAGVDQLEGFKRQVVDKRGCADIVRDADAIEEALAQGTAAKEAEADDPISQALARLTPAQLAELKSRLK
jgi:hypothetical protein